MHFSFSSRDNRAHSFLVAHATCPSGFELPHAGECRGKYVTMNQWWDEAATMADAKCKEIGGKPMIIHSEEVSIFHAGSDHAADSHSNYLIRLVL